MRAELGATWSLAWPLVLAEIAWILMGLVDTIFVGPLGPAAIGAVGTGSTMFFAVMVLGIGTFYALDTFVAQNFGRQNIQECHRWLFTGLQVALILSAVLVGLGLVGVALLSKTGMHPDVLAILQPYLRRLLLSAPPLLVYTVCRRYLQAMHVVRPMLVVAIVTNVVNAIGNWVFVYGHLGVPAMGAVGSAYATLIARLVLAALLAWVIVRRERRWPSGLHDVPFAWDRARMWRLVRLGMPAAAQVTLEVGVFAVASALAGRISPAALAANQVALNIAGFFFMVPFGISSAAAVRVGHAVGRGDVRGVRLAGWAALVMSLAFAFAIASAFVLAPRVFLLVFTRDPDVVRVGVAILGVCAVFQPFDGMQAVATGALRGLGDTRTPMIANLGFHWLVGLPLGYMLCFSRGWGVVGLWVGLSAGLILVGLSLVATWHVRSARVRPEHLLE